METTPRLAKIALTLSLLLPVYFAAAALGTKFGLWEWKIGLMTLTLMGGPIVLSLAALTALVSLILILRRKPRRGWPIALLALLVPVVLFGGLGLIGSQAAKVPPIHDVATDTADPPAFSAATLAAREAAGANPINDYQATLGTLDPWKDAAPDLADRSHASIIAKAYPDLTPLPLGSASAEQALEAVAAAMKEMNFADVAVDTADGRVEGVAETFWFGFKDDVVARVADGRIDFRSVSRVGLSDLGANAKRIGELKAKVAARLNG